MNPYNFSVLFFAFCTFFISLLIWLKRPGKIERSYFIFSIFVTIWGIGFSILINQDASDEMALLADRIANFAAVFIPATWLHFILIFTGNNRYRNLLKALYVLAAVIDCFAFTPLFIPKVKPIMGFNHYGHPGIIYHFFTLMFYTVVPFGFIQLIKAIRRATGDEKFRLKGFMIATLAGFTGGGLTFLPAYDIPCGQYGLFLMPLYPFVMAYFMMRVQLFNLEELAQAARKDKLAAIGTLATSINHEIRNPLYVIQGLAESHLENFKDGIYATNVDALEKCNEILKKTAEQATRAMEIMKNFSVFAKKEIKESASLESVDLNETLEGILPLIRHELELDKIELIRNIPCDSAQMKADKRHLEEIFFNLIVNACQAMKNQKEKGRIAINASSFNGTVKVTLEDNGPGISSDRLSKIFEPFYTTKQEGTGLGLYVTRQLIEKNGGKISVKSCIGKGTNFTLEFKK